jgi:hypothetical protein
MSDLKYTFLLRSAGNGQIERKTFLAYTKSKHLQSDSNRGPKVRSHLTGDRTPLCRSHGLGHSTYHVHQTLPIILPLQKSQQQLQSPSLRCYRALNTRTRSLSPTTTYLLIPKLFKLFHRFRCACSCSLVFASGMQ